MFDRSDSVPMSRMPPGMPTRNPAIHVAVAGVRKRGCTRLNILGSRPSRDIENHTRAWPSWKTSSDEIMPIIAPKSTASSVQCSSADLLVPASLLIALTTGAASSTSVDQFTMPVSTTATAM